MNQHWVEVSCLPGKNDCSISPGMFSFLDEGVYVDTFGKISKNVVLQWGELPTSVGKLLAIISPHHQFKTKEIPVCVQPLHFAPDLLGQYNYIYGLKPNIM